MAGDTIQQQSPLHQSMDKTMHSLDPDQIENYEQQLDQLKLSLKDKDLEISKSESHNQELETKLQKLLMEFA